MGSLALDILILLFVKEEGGGVFSACVGGTMCLEICQSVINSKSPFLLDNFASRHSPVQKGRGKVTQNNNVIGIVL